MKKVLKLAGILFVLGILIFLFYISSNYATPILMYHSFDKNRIKDYAAVDLANFYKQMQFIKKEGYRVISLGDYCRMLKDRRNIPRKAVIITIDDGYQDNLAAIEILRKFDYPATLFLTWDRIGKDGYLSTQDINTFLKNTKVGIGSHSLTHPDLPNIISNGELKDQISGSKNKLEELLPVKIETFAFPGGGFNERSLEELAKAGYLCACTTNRGFSRKLNRLALRRIKVTNQDNNFTFWSKISGFYNVFKKPKKPY